MVSRVFFVLLIASITILVCSQQANQAPLPPPFLIGAPAETISEFQKLLADSESKTDEQVDKDVENWISKQSSTIKLKFADFKAQMKQNEQQADEYHKAAIAKLSPEAKEADIKLSALANNPALTAAQKQQQIDSFIKGLPANIRMEIDKIMQG